MACRSAEIGTDGVLDLVVLPEDAVCGGRNGTAAERSVPLHGPVLEIMGEKAREYATYLIVPLFLAEGNTYSNAAVLLDRTGGVVGTYRKVHPVAARGSKTLEGGVTPGNDHPVFDCDFGKLGIQICFDMRFDDGWETLAQKGAELVAWPTQSPQTVLPAARAQKHAYYLVSSTWRNNTTLFEPTGMVAAQTEDDPILVHQIDLSYAILHWQSELRHGDLVSETFGPRAGYHYSEREDTGLFWSNDPDTSIGKMIRDLNLETEADLLARNTALQKMKNAARC